MTQQPRVVIVKDRMQQGYRYALMAPAGRNFNSEFRPDLTPKEMLALGVFCGKYMPAPAQAPASVACGYRLFIHATATMANIPAITPRKNHAQCSENQNEAISSTAPTSNANEQRVACF
jgi:hypothetical protein